MKAILQAAKVSRHMGEPDRKASLGSEHYIGALRRPTLDKPKRVAIKTELERVFGPRMASEFGIEHLIAPTAQCGGPINAFEKVGNAMPAIGEKDRLIN